MVFSFVQETNHQKQVKDTKRKKFKIKWKRYCRLFLLYYGEMYFKRCALDFFVS